LLDYETLQKTKIFGEQTAAGRNGVIAKKIACRRPEDWTVSGRAISNTERKLCVMADQLI